MNCCGTLFGYAPAAGICAEPKASAGAERKGAAGAALKEAVLAMGCVGGPQAGKACLI